MKQRHKKHIRDSANAELWWIGVDRNTKFSDLRKEHIKKVKTCADEHRFQNYPDSNKSREQNFFEWLLNRANMKV